MSDDDYISNNPSQNNLKKPIAAFYKQAKEQADDINEALMRNIEILDSENMKLKKSINDLNSDSKEKSQALEDSQKLILKLKDEYAKVFKENKDLETYVQEVEEENKDLKKMFVDVNKTQITFENIKKHNDSLKAEVDKLKKENQGLKTLNIQKKNNITEIEKEDREKLGLLKTSVNRIESLEASLAEKDLLINESNIKIQDLLQILDRKENEIKTLVKKSQICDQENKNNVDELTRQANTTIKLFYSSVTGDKNLSPEIKNQETSQPELVSNSKAKPYFTINTDLVKDRNWVALFDEIFVNTLKNSGLQREVQENLSIHCEIMKTELLSSLFRENNIVDYLTNSVQALNVKSDNGKTVFENIIKGIEDLNREIDVYKEEIKKLNLEKAENDKQMDILKANLAKYVSLINAKLSDKDSDIDTHQRRIKQLEDDLAKLTAENEKMNGLLLEHAKDKNIKDDIKNLIMENNQLQETLDKLKNEIEGLRKDKDRLGKEVDRLQAEIDRLSKENEKLHNENLRLQDEIGRLSKENSRLHNSLDNDNSKEEIEKLKKDLNTTREELLKNANNIGDVERDNGRLSLELEKKKRENEALQNQLKEKSKFHNLTSSSTENLSYNKIRKDLLNESFSEKNYQAKKEEIEKLKNEVSRLKEEVMSLIKENNEVKEELTRILSNYNENRKICCEEVKHSVHGLQKNPVPIQSSKIPHLQHQLSNNLQGQTKEMILIDVDVKSESNNNKQPQLNMLLNSEVSEMTQKMQFEISKSECSICCNILEKFNDLKLNLKYTTFKELKNFYISYHVDIDKASSKLEEVLNKITLAENTFSNENNDHKTKTSKVKEILSQIKKLVSILGVFISKYNKEIYFYTQNLKRVFDFVSKLVYSSNSIMSGMPKPMQQSITSDTNTIMMPKSELDKKRTNLIESILIMMCDSSLAISKQEAQKISSIYENRTIKEIMEVFKTNCDVFKQNLTEAKWDFETEFSEDDSSIVKLTKQSEFGPKTNNMNTSYKIVNDRILKLKKFEFFYFNVIDLFKHYLVIQEIILRSLFQNLQYNSLDSKFMENYKNKVDIINKLYYMLEDTMLYKVNDLEEYPDIVLSRKLVLKLIKNHKTILFMTMENKS